MKNEWIPGMISLAADSDIYADSYDGVRTNEKEEKELVLKDKAIVKIGEALTKKVTDAKKIRHSKKHHNKSKIS
jgi:hypothetical protein